MVRRRKASAAKRAFGDDSDSENSSEDAFQGYVKKKAALGHQRASAVDASIAEAGCDGEAQPATAEAAPTAPVRAAAYVAAAQQRREDAVEAAALRAELSRRLDPESKQYITATYARQQKVTPAGAGAMESAAALAGGHGSDNDVYVSPAPVRDELQGAVAAFLESRRTPEELARLRAAYLERAGVQAGADP